MSSELQPVSADTALPEEKRHRLDRLYQRIVTDLDVLWRGRSSACSMTQNSKLTTQDGTAADNEYEILVLDP